jgi:hypothetical protein
MSIREADRISKKGANVVKAHMKRCPKCRARTGRYERCPTMEGIMKKYSALCEKAYFSKK